MRISDWSSDVCSSDLIVAGLNPAETNGILQILTELNRSGITLIFVEHDVRAVLLVSTRLVVLAQGSLLKEGLPHEVVRSPDVIRVYLAIGRASCRESVCRAE